MSVVVVVVNSLERAHTRESITRRCVKRFKVCLRRRRSVIESVLMDLPNSVHPRCDVWLSLSSQQSNIDIHQSTRVVEVSISLKNDSTR